MALLFNLCVCPSVEGIGRNLGSTSKIVKMNTVIKKGDVTIIIISISPLFFFVYKKYIVKVVFK